MYGKKEFNLIGRLVVKQYPEIAKGIVDCHLKHQPVETDYSKIKSYYEHFKLFYQGPLTKLEAVNMRRTFLACMLNLYNPVVYTQPINNIIIPRNFFVKKIAEVFEMTDANISKMIRIVVSDMQTAKKNEENKNGEESIYEAFKKDVENCVKILQNIT